MRRQAVAGSLLAPVVGGVIAVWAEFADLDPPLLLAVAVPAVVASTLSAAFLLRAGPIVVVLIGVVAGFLAFAIAEGGYLALHYARGGRLNFEGFDGQGQMAGALFGIHVAVGASVGLCVGAALGLVIVVRRALRLRRDLAA